MSQFESLMCALLNADEVKEMSDGGLMVRHVDGTTKHVPAVDVTICAEV